MDYKIPAFNEPIKALIDSYEPGKLTTIYGNAASGKTTACLLASISCAKDKGKVIYIDTESGFNSERLKQLYFGDIQDILENIFLIQPKTYEEQHDTILKLKRLCDNDKIKLVVVDTIGSLYRKELIENPKGVNSMMAEQVATLIRVARDLNKVVIITNQVSSRLDGSQSIKMVGGKMMENMSKVIIELRKDETKRIARLIKYKYDSEDNIHPNIDYEVNFEIKEKGLFLCD